jgi:hypothetical protein
VLSRAELLKLLVALIRMNDSQVLSTDEGLPPDVSAPEDRKKVRDLRGLLIAIRRFFDYTESPEFLESIEGKSDAVGAMRRKLASHPMRKKEYLDRLDTALESLLTSRDAYRLVAAKRHGDVDGIRRILSSLSNPQ